MNIIVHRGFRQIGGNIIEISTDHTHLLVDAGIELNGDQHPVDLNNILEATHFDAILISHYHADHVELLNQIHDLPPVYFGHKAFQVYRKAKEYTGQSIGFTSSYWLENNSSFQIGDICITPYLADHSAIDSYSFLFEADRRKVLYTGDFRGSGWKSFDRYIHALPEKVDAVICEGTTLSRDAVRNVCEADLANQIYEKIKGCNDQVFILLSAMNLDRIVTAYKAAKKCNRIFLQDLYTAELTSECRDVHIPNPLSFADTFAFTCMGLSEEGYLSAKQRYKHKFLGREQVAKKKYCMCIRNSRAMLSYLQKLNVVSPLNGSILIYSIWNGYQQQPAMQHFLTEVSQMGVSISSFHTSGHADSHDIRRLISRINPSVIIPIHTENENWFIREYGGKCAIHTNGVCEV